MWLGYGNYFDGLRRGWKGREEVRVGMDLILYLLLSGGQNSSGIAIARAVA